ncbi:unnamed protein product [Ectocarpus fasciculatus]
MSATVDLHIAMAHNAAAASVGGLAMPTPRRRGGSSKQCRSSAFKESRTSLGSCGGHIRETRVHLVSYTPTRSGHRHTEESSQSYVKRVPVAGCPPPFPVKTR